MSREIIINRVKQILDAVDDKNVENFIKDFSDYLRIIVMVKKVDPEQINLINKTSFTWIDDGKNNVHIRFHEKEGK